MVDQCHNLEPKVPAMIRPVMTLQEHWLKANLVDREALRAAHLRVRIPMQSGVDSLNVATAAAVVFHAVVTPVG